jgi:P4 family phage/plasmid primase-like protien
MLGLMPKHQKSVLFYDPYGRAGKGTMERFLRGLVPDSFVTAISPFRWSHDYHVATLAGKRLNVVGELPENEAIPASSFKTVIGGDLITGRHPTHRPITFTNEAAHVFMGNHLIMTKDQSEAFYSRWLIVHFPNSLLRSGRPIDTGLAERIIADELPGIAYWALEGAKRLVANRDFSKSTAHDRLMAKWRRSTSSLGEFIYECCELVAEDQVRRSDFYRSYTAWCDESGRKPFSKSRVKDLLENNIGLGVRLAEINGHEVFRGLRLKPAETKSGIRELNDPDQEY